MDSVNLSPTPTQLDLPLEQATYVPPAVIYEAPLEVRAGTIFSSPPDPLNLFGTNGN
jgi:hypothetical protein